MVPILFGTDSVKQSALNLRFPIGSICSENTIVGGSLYAMGSTQITVKRSKKHVVEQTEAYPDWTRLQTFHGTCGSVIFVLPIVVDVLYGCSFGGLLLSVVVMRHGVVIFGTDYQSPMSAEFPLVLCLKKPVCLAHVLVRFIII